MSGPLARVARLKSEVRLAQAVSEFEAELSNDQKVAFRVDKSRSLSSPPGPSDVMRLTAEIDHRVSKKGSGRCYGPRFTNFLQVVQQFAALGDVIVGGSQNLIACSVWSIVRMSLLSFANYSSYLEKLSTLFMNVGRSAPRYQQMALLYPRSKNLRTDLSEYFIVVVRLCQRLLKYTQKSILLQVASSLNDSDINTFQTELGKWASSIKEEVGFLMANRIEEKSQEILKIGIATSELSKSVTHQQKLVAKLRVLDFCSTYDYETTWKQQRKIGNATPFKQAPGYQEWKKEAHASTLLYTGKLGSGKSVLLANIVDDLHMYHQDKNMTVAYFFCRYDIHESLKARTIIGSLVRQLLRPLPNLVTVSDSWDDSTRDPDIEELLDILHHALPSGYKAYFVLDGLDDCNGTERENLIKWLQSCQQHIALHLCVSLRVDSRNALPLSFKDFENSNIVSMPEDNPDIESFIQSELELCLMCGKLVLGEPTLVLEIQDALLKGSQGMFLWTALQIRTICAMKTDQSIRDALANLPKDLPETFSRILRRSAEEFGKLGQRRTLQIIAAAYRPLTASELREALSVVPKIDVRNSERLVNDVYSALACCGCLIDVDEEESTVRFVHHSVKQFLLSEDVDEVAFTMQSAQRTTADVIVTYLNYGVFGTELSTTRVQHVKIGSARSKIITSTIGSSHCVQRHALKLLGFSKQPNFDISKTLAEARKPSRPVNSFHYYTYARSHWLWHAFFTSGQEVMLCDLLRRLCKRNDLKMNIDTTAEEIWEFLHWASIHINDNIAKIIFDYGKVDANLILASGDTLLTLAVVSGNEDLVKLLLKTNKIDANLENRHRQTPLMIAFYNSRAAIAGLLLATGKVDVNIKASYQTGGETLLMDASKKGNNTMVGLLLATGKVRVDAQDNVGKTALFYALESGCKDVVTLLLTKGKAYADAQDSLKRTVFLYASKEGNKTITELLLVTGKVNINIQDSSGRTPLSYASGNGHELVVEVLLATAKVKIDKPDSLGRTPLSYASGRGHEAVVKLLLTTGKVDVNVQDSSRGTPLLHASRSGREAVVKLLLAKGEVDVDIPDSLGRTPLSCASERGHEAVVELLLATGRVDVNACDSYQRTPLSYASRNGHAAVVRLLLTTSETDVSRKDHENRTPLYWAIIRGYEPVVGLFLATGKIDINEKYDQDLTPLLLAVQHRHVATFKLMLEFGKGSCNKQGPLFKAIELGQVDIVQIFCEMGEIDLSMENDTGFTLLSWAITREQVEMTEMLLKRGKFQETGLELNVSKHLAWQAAQKEYQDAVKSVLLTYGDVNNNDSSNHGEKLLMSAATGGYENLVNLLLSTGMVDVDWEDYWGNTALTCAAQGRHLEIVKALEQYRKPNVSS